jgi:RimJ/RimL family protein N-acetyltransferase
MTSRTGYTNPRAFPISTNNAPARPAGAFSSLTATLFQTDRLRIRPWTLSDQDVAQAYAMYSNPEVARFIRDAPEESLETQRATLERVRARFVDAPEGIGWWAVELKETGRVIGTVSIKPLPGYDHVEVGYHLARRYWGHGYATEAAGGLLNTRLRNCPSDRSWPW